MSEYKGKGKGKEIKLDTVLDEFNRLTLGESRGRPSRARGSHDSFSDEDESMEENPRNKKEKQSRSKKPEKQSKQKIKK